MRIIICVMLLFFSCNNAEISNEEAVKTTKKEVSEISKTVIEKLKYTDYGLSLEAKEITNSWVAYKSLQDQINYLKEADLSFFKSDQKEMEAFIKELKTSIPKSLDEKSITSRLLVLETKMLKLNDDLLLANNKTAAKLKSIKELFTAFSNLNFRINKLLEFNIYNEIRPE